MKSRTGAPALYYLMELGMMGYCVYMAIDAASQEEWSQFTYACHQLLTMLIYAMVQFIGVRAMLQDLWASFRQNILRQESDCLTIGPARRPMEYLQVTGAISFLSHAKARG